MNVSKRLTDEEALHSSNVQFCSKHKNMKVAWEPSEEFPTCPVCKTEMDHATGGKPANVEKVT